MSSYCITTRTQCVPIFYDRWKRTKGRVIGDSKRDTTRRASGIGARLKSCIALYSVNTSYFLFEEREIVAMFVGILHKLIRT